MYKYFFTLVIIAATRLLCAQGPGNSAWPVTPFHLQPQLSSAGPGAYQPLTGISHKTEDLYERLIGYSTTEWLESTNTWRYSDSITWRYSGNRGSVVLTNNVYDEKHHLQYTNGICWNDEQTIYERNAQGGATAYYGFAWNGGTTYDSSYRYLYTLNSFGKPTYTLIQNRNGWQWDNSEQLFETYDNWGNVNSAVSYRWQDTAWLNGTRNTYVYDSAGHILFFQWEQGTPTGWLIAQRDTATYNEDGQLQYEEHATLTAGVLTPDTRSFYSYLPTADSSSITEERYIGGTWQNSMLTTSKKNGWGQETSRTQYVWYNNQWYNYSSEENKLNTDGKLISHTRYDTDINGNWIFYDRAIYTYTNGLPEQRIYQYYTDTGWLNIQSYRYTYNSAGLCDTETNRYWIADDWKNRERNIYSYTPYDNISRIDYQTWRTSTWADSIRTKFYYEEFTAPTGITTPIMAPLQLYPNPASTAVFIDCAIPLDGAVQYLLTDATGHCLREETLAQQQSTLCIPVESLSAGLYFITLRQNGTQRTVRFLKQ